MPGMFSDIVIQALTNRPSLNLPRTFKLPCLPQSVVKFISISNDAIAGARELAAPLEADSALTAALLRQVNSPAVGVRQSVASVPQAINLLGLRRTKNLVLASALHSATEKLSSRLINNTWFQKENRTRAAFARRTALVIAADADVAYLAGLLQDFMLPLLSEAFHTEYQGLLNKGRELAEEEEQRFGWNHAFVAAGLMHDWGFPDELVACVLLHHDAKRVLADASLRETAVGATVAAASLPESLHQSPAGFEMLLELQKVLPGYCFLTVAGDVDDELTEGKHPQGHGDGLCDRLGKLAEANLEQQRLDRVQQH
jgi:eukaryotic-like serine/threonine-protein kinase